MEIKFQNFLCYPCHRTLPQLLQFLIFMNLYFVYVINIRFICDGEIYLLTYLLIELFPSAYSLCRNKNFVSMSKNLLKNGISTFSIVLFHIKTFVSETVFHS